MRRGLPIVILVMVLGSLASPAFGQYPYPPAYPPMPYGPPAYGPPMMPMPYYQPAPMWQPPAPPRPNVIIYGPLTAPEAPKPRPAPAPMPVQQPTPRPVATSAAKTAKSDIVQVQATSPPRALIEKSPIKRTQMVVPDACGPTGCDDGLLCPAYAPCDYGPCDPVYGKPPPAVRGHGRFIGEVGAYFLVPFTDSRLAYTTTNPIFTGGEDFPRTTYFGPRGSFGYMFHTGWGVRANYFYLTGSVNRSVTNTDLTTQIVTPLAAPFEIVSPSLTLQQGIGADQLSFRQRLELQVADAECLREMQWMDMTFLFSFGGRYARLLQDYSASRNNPGGFNGLTTVNIDREDLTSSSRFEGWGPTGSIELVCMLGKSNLSAYTNFRGSYLWGVHRYSQDYNAQRHSVSNTGVPTFDDVGVNHLLTDRRTIGIAEAEGGLQYGCDVGRCYFFTRAGAVYQRWWDVGHPTAADGSLNFLGGTVRVGVTY